MARLRFECRKTGGWLARSAGAFIGVCVFAAATPSMAAPQEAATTPAIAPDHWAVDVVRRLAWLGLLPHGVDPADATYTWERIEGLLMAGRGRAREERPELYPLLTGHLERLREEMGALEPEHSLPLRLDVHPFVEATAANGAVRTGYGYDRPEIGWTGPESVDPPNAEVGLNLMLSSASLWALRLQASAHSPTSVLLEGEATLEWRVLGLWAGRRRLSWQPGLSGSVVLGQPASFTGGGLYLTQPIRLSGPLAWLGPLHLQSFLARTESNGPIERPWFWAARATASPHPRLGVGVTRGAMAGGEGNADLDAREVLYLLIGKHGTSSRVENQVASLDLWFRPPIDDIPLVIFLEWGMDDSAGAWRDVPGVLAGIAAPALPGAPRLSAALEHARFAGSCCGNPPWYRHIAFLEGWTLDGEPLAHPLGGHGREWRAHFGADYLDDGWALEVSAYWRDRDGENLYAPDRLGESIGSGLSLALRLSERVHLRLRAELEEGRQNWTERYVHITARAFLP